MITRQCPLCGKIYNDPPAISRKDSRIKICPDCGTREALEPAVERGIVTQNTVEEIIKATRRQGRRPSAYERERDRVYASGNRWAIENFHATHD